MQGPEPDSKDTIGDLVPVVAASWRGGWRMVAMRATRGWRHWRSARVGYNYYTAAVPGMVAPVAYTAGKVDYEDSKYDC